MKWTQTMIMTTMIMTIESTDVQLSSETAIKHHPQTPMVPFFFLHERIVNVSQLTSL